MQNYRKKMLFVAIWLLTTTLSYGQSPIWLVGNQNLNPSLLNPNALPIPPNGNQDPVYADYNGQQAEYASNAYHHPISGELLFFIIDGVIYDGDGYRISVMYNGGSNYVYGVTEVSIVPDPSNCKRYYIFGLMVSNNFCENDNNEDIVSELYYGILDLSIPRDNPYVENSDRYGDLILMPNDEYVYPAKELIPSGLHQMFQGIGATQLAVTPRNASNAHYIFYQSANQYLFAFKLDDLGLSYANSSVFSVKDGLVPPVYTQTSFPATRSQLEVLVLPNGGFRIVGKTLDIETAYPVNLPNGADRLYKVDYSSSCIPIPSSYAFHSFASPAGISVNNKGRVKGIEISQNGQYVYITKTTDSSHPLAFMGFDINTMTPINLPNVNVANAEPFQYSCLELADNGILYAARNGGLHPIIGADTPNALTLGILTTPVANGINLSRMNRSTNIPAWQNKFALYLLPDQMDFIDYCLVDCYDFTCGDGSAAEACCHFYSNTNVAISGDIIISQNTIWSPGITNNPFQSASGFVALSANIIVQPGVEFIIDNMILKMSPNSKITVERGASSNQIGGTLKATNSTLTKSDACGACSMWPGIEVQGYPNLPNTSDAHATAVFDNTTIEYAYFGAVAGTFVAPNSLTFQNSHSGGRIVAVNSTFRNNKIDVFFRPYAYPNAGIFLFTNFLSDDNLMVNLTGSVVHAFLWNVQNVRFLSCRFENETSFKPDGESRGIGIGSANSHFIVDKLSSINPTFNKLDVGVRTTASSSGLNYIVRNAVFNNNYSGIVSEGELNSHILKNTFNIYKAGPNNAITQTYGVVMSSCSRYRIEENLFQDASPNLNITAFNNGCRIVNSGTSANVVEKNEFRNLRSAGISSGINATDYSQIGSKKGGGLQWLCNDFYNSTIHDLWVTNGRIAPFQGTCFSGALYATSQPAGNVFNNSNNPQWHVKLETGVLPITYYHRQYDYNTEPTLISSGVTPYACFMPSGAVVCGRQTQVPGLTEGEALDSLQEYFNEKLIFENTLDYGSREELLLDVLGDLLSPEQKRELLLGTNTTISDEILIKYLQTSPPNTLLFQVMLENSPLSDRAMYYVMEESTLPSGMKQQLLYAQNGISVYDASMQYLQNIELEIMNIENELIYRYLSDTTNTYSILDVIDMFELYPSHDENTMESLFGAYVRAGLYEKADSLNTILKASFSDPDYGILTDLALASINTDYYTMISSDSTLLEQLEEWSIWSDQRFGPFARTLLTNYYGYFFPVVFDEGGSTRNMAYPDYKLKDFEPNITIFPNPASDHFFIVFDEHADVSQSREARVYDLAGNLQFTRSFEDNAYVLEINTDNMTKGMYIVVISENGTDVGTYKVAVR